MDLVELGADLRLDLVDLADLGVDLVDLGADLGVDLADLGGGFSGFGGGFSGFGGRFRQESYCQERWLRVWNIYR